MRRVAEGGGRWSEGVVLVNLAESLITRPAALYVGSLRSLRPEEADGLLGEVGGEESRWLRVRTAYGVACSPLAIDFDSPTFRVITAIISLFWSCTGCTL